MKKNITITCIVLSALLILDTANAGHALVMFFLAGIIPGTNVSLSADAMLSLFALLAGFTLSRVASALTQFASTHQSRLSATSATRA